VYHAQWQISIVLTQKLQNTLFFDNFKSEMIHFLQIVLEQFPRNDTDLSQMAEIFTAKSAKRDN
jgi:hypothetical protein